ncbi:hypothetical protein [uncultured Paracoccus sp.]|uniref:hypothetical protein n=1 Tax=uncultured Paracoccus sp. TaxID=189685 RepID=UPI002619C6A9|nr:hypothetical protein [uncultured Paracoccus sp.]
MTRNIALTLAALPLLLAACGTPQERCISKNTREYRNVSNLLREVEGNLARGYAWEERVVYDEILTQCRDLVRDREGNARVIYTPCWRDVSTTERYRVSIDPAAEQRKRANLAARQKDLAGQAEAYVRACQAAYPEEQKAAQ